MMYENCRRLVEACCKAGLIRKVAENGMMQDGDGNTVPVPPESVGKLLIYHAAGTLEPEGWYAEDLEDVAQNLTKDRAGQKYLLKRLEEKGIKTEFIDEAKFHEDAKDMLAFLSNVAELPSWSR